MMTCSAPADCAEIERRRSTGIGLLANGGSSRGNLLSGDAEEVILTVSRIEAETKGVNKGYRAFFAVRLQNVTRSPSCSSCGRSFSSGPPRFGASVATSSPGATVEASTP